MKVSILGSVISLVDAEEYDRVYIGRKGNVSA